MIPETVHYGRARELTRQRSITLAAAFRGHPNRVKGVAPGSKVFTKLVCSAAQHGVARGAGPARGVGHMALVVEPGTGHAGVGGGECHGAERTLVSALADGWVVGRHGLGFQVFLAGRVAGGKVLQARTTA